MNNLTTKGEKPKIKIALIVDEYFGALGTAYGGYGFLARRYISKYLPDNEIEIEVLLGKGKYNFKSEENVVDGINVYKLPRRKWFASQWALLHKDFKDRAFLSCLNLSDNLGVRSAELRKLI